MDLNQSDWKLQCEANENSIIIDVRTEHEVAEGIIPDAINIDIYGGQLFIDEINKLDKSKSYFLYCKAGR
jgi:rhodanese-related sulfurtransferase